MQAKTSILMVIFLDLEQKWPGNVHYMGSVGDGQVVVPVLLVKAPETVLELLLCSQCLSVRESQ